MNVNRCIQEGGQWTRVAAQLPPEGIAVETKIDDRDGCRNVQSLKRSRGLWWTADGTMYVYYSPTHWRYLL